MQKVDSQEVELKLPIINKEDIIEKLIKLGAVFISDTEQTDYLFNPPDSHFAKTGEAFRLRHEKFEKIEKAYITYKGSAKFSSQGHKIRVEYEIEVSDFKKAKQILEALHFQVVKQIKKNRKTYHREDIIVAVDTLAFGTFIELEGDSVKSQKLREALGLGNVEPIKKAYYDLQEEWEKGKKVILENCLFIPTSKHIPYGFFFIKRYFFIFAFCH